MKFTQFTGETMVKAAISGYYGFKNSGDDALLQAIINDLKQYLSDKGIPIRLVK